MNRGDTHRDKNRPGENARPEAQVETEDAIAHHSPNMPRENQANSPCQRPAQAIGAPDRGVSPAVARILILLLPFLWSADA